MRRILAILLGLILGFYMFLETDTILAHTDRALADLAKHPGVPRVVLQVRKKVHAYRYYRATGGATAQKSVSTIGMLKFAQDEATPTPTPWCPECPARESGHRNRSPGRDRERRRRAGRSASPLPVPVRPGRTSRTATPESARRRSAGGRYTSPSEGARPSDRSGPSCWTGTS